MAPLLSAAFMAQPSRFPLFGDRFSVAEIWARVCVFVCVTIYLFIPGVSSQLFSLFFYWRICDFVAFLDSASLLFLFIRISDFG